MRQDGVAHERLGAIADGPRPSVVDPREPAVDPDPDPAPMATDVVLHAGIGKIEVTDREAPVKGDHQVAVAEAEFAGHGSAAGLTLAGRLITISMIGPAPGRGSPRPAGTSPSELPRGPGPDHVTMSEPVMVVGWTSHRKKYVPGVLGAVNV